MTTSPVLLRPITDDEYPSWMERAAASFAAGVGPARSLTPDEALAVAYEQTEQLLPEGPATDQQLIWIAVAGDEPVGSLWISTKAKVPFIYGIEVDHAHRGKGYGRAIMLAAEEECRRLGYTQLDLNVFGDNNTAIALYDSLGYAVISQQMRKDL
ncbi:GNAT family N-acetyltransferase [Kribbella sp. NPDC003505]|uniref:GNAT family N-acetyltransferase n=1 Tax=Kribbella sp. NPDC003505 TaxID=3154448 RepID=UPI0033BD0650